MLPFPIEKNIVANNLEYLFQDLDDSDVIEGSIYQQSVYLKNPLLI